jgi:hypothetical protein
MVHLFLTLHHMSTYDAAMPRVSKSNLSKTAEEDIKQTFNIALSSISNDKDISVMREWRETPVSSVQPAEHRGLFSPRLAASLSVPLLIAACGGAPATEAPKPTMTPSTTPAATETATPPASPTTVVMESPTATPTPEATKPQDSITIQSFIADIKAGGGALDKYRVPITNTQLQQDFDAFMASPAGASAPANIKLAFADCIGTDPNKIINACAITTTMTFVTIAKTDTLEAVKFAQDMADLGITRIFTTPDNLSVLLQGLEATAANF